jgi:hypothetical protein
LRLLLLQGKGRLAFGSSVFVHYFHFVLTTSHHLTCSRSSSWFQSWLMGDQTSKDGPRTYGTYRKIFFLFTRFDDDGSWLRNTAIYLVRFGFDSRYIFGFPFGRD